MSSGPRARPALFALVAASVVVGSMIVLWLTTTASGPVVVPPAATPARTPQVILLSPADVTRLETAISSDDPAVSSASLVPALRQTQLEQHEPLLPPGATARIDSATMTAVDDVGTVNVAVVGGPEPGLWRLLLQQVDERWLIFGTERQ